MVTGARAGAHTRIREHARRADERMREEDEDERERARERGREREQGHETTRREAKAGDARHGGDES